MKTKIFLLSFLVLSIMFLSTNVLAYETYDISSSDLESGYTKDLSPGDRINFPIGANTGYVTVSSVYVNSAVMYIFAHDRQQFTGTEHPDHSDIFSHEMKYEMTEDNYYDLKVTLNSAVINEDETRVASVTLKKINEEIPEGTEIYYDCWKYHECSDGTKIKYCDYSSNGMCGCRSVSSSECPQENDDDEGDSCTQWYTCPDGSQVKKCEIAPNGMCGCRSHPEDLCESEEEEEEQTHTTTYFKSCSYIWDSSNYVGQDIKISASIKDSTGNSKSDSVEIEVVDGNIGSGGSGRPMDGKNLDIQINEPAGTQVRTGAVEIKISSKGPNELGEMSLGFSGDNWGAGFPISNRNCVSGGSSGGGGSGGSNSTCEKYYTCEDGAEVQYCEIVKQYDENGNIVGAGCGCKSNPEELCTSSSSGASWCWGCGRSSSSARATRRASRSCCRCWAPTPSAPTCTRCSTT